MVKHRLVWLPRRGRHADGPPLVASTLKEDVSYSLPECPRGPNRNFVAYDIPLHCLFQGSGLERTETSVLLGMVAQTDATASHLTMCIQPIEKARYQRELNMCAR